MKKPFKILLINILVFWIFSEIVLCFYFAIRNQQFITPLGLYEKYFPADALSNERCSWGAQAGIHPYLSIYYPEKEKCRSFIRNNYGLRSKNIPLELDQNYYTILIAGGSVAEQIGMGNFLDEYLNEHWLSPNKKPFRVINAGIPGVRQPVTLIQMVLFSKVADEVISFEGYNEHFGADGGVLIEEPSRAWFNGAFQATSPLHFYSMEFFIHQIRSMKKSIFQYSYTYFAFVRLSLDYLYNYLEQKQNLLNPFPKPDPSWDQKKQVEYYLNSYLYYVRLAADLLFVQKKPYTLFIQPAPYQYKTLTPEEIKAIGDISGQGKYDRVKDALKTQLMGKIKVESAEKIFEDVKESLYIDHIHTNPEGVKMLSKFIAERLAKNHGWKSK